MMNVILNRENKISEVSRGVFFFIFSDQTHSTNVNLIIICYEK